MSSGVGLYRLKIMKKLFERIIARLRNYNLLFTIVKIIMLSERMFFIFFVNYSSWLYSQPASRRYSRGDGQPDIVILPNANPFFITFLWGLFSPHFYCIAGVIFTNFPNFNTTEQTGKPTSLFHQCF